MRWSRKTALSLTRITNDKLAACHVKRQFLKVLNTMQQTTSFHQKRIFVAGHRGMVGSAIVGALKQRGYSNIVTRTHAELDLTDQAQVRTFFASRKIDEVYLAAARVGGIHANNTYPAEFIHQNLMIEMNVIHQAWCSGVQKLLFLGSSCIYPRMAEQPMKEEYLLSGALEPTNEPYAIAKIAGIKLCESYNRQYGTDYRSVMPTNLYGPGDNYHPENSHVLPALLRRFHEAKLNNADKVVVWGTGTPRREFLYVDDMADASVHVMELGGATYDANTTPMLSHVNVGTGEEFTIREVAELISNAVGFRGRIEFDTSKPDGSPRKLMDSSKLSALGWTPKVRLGDGIVQTYRRFLAEHAMPESVPSSIA
jgi:GDP-L-fucose synthase